MTYIVEDNEVPPVLIEQGEVPKKEDKPKKSKPWYVQVIILIGLIIGSVIFFPTILIFIICIAAVGIIPFCCWQICSFLKEIPKQRRIRLTNANYCRLEVRKLEIKKGKL